MTRTLLFSLALITAGCSVESDSNSAGGGAAGTSAAGGKAGSDKKGMMASAPGATPELSSDMTGDIKINGSSTVYPISAAIAEEFMKATSTKVDVGQAGTGGGFKQFVTGETDISDASRPIKDSEAAQAKENGIEYVELQVAIDGISVVVHPDNDWAEAMTVAELKKLFEAGSTVTKWSDIRNGWPEEDIKLYGPDPESGTFDYFTEEVLDKGDPRDYTQSEDDNVLVNGVAGNKNALGYFGYSYYVNNKDRIKAVAIAEGDDLSAAVAPTPETIASGEYTPLARPLFLYVNTEKAKSNPILMPYLQYYVSDEGQVIAAEEDFVTLDDAKLAELREKVAALGK